MRKNELTQKRLKELLSYNPDTGIFTWIKSNGSKIIYTRAGCVAKQPNPDHEFRVIRIDKKIYPEHRLAIFYMEGRMPKGVLHKNGDLKDNRWANLERCTLSETRANVEVSKDSKTGVKGVTPHGPGFRADCRGKYLGTFPNIEEAKAAYDKAARKQYGSALREPLSYNRSDDRHSSGLAIQQRRS